MKVSGAMAMADNLEAFGMTEEAVLSDIPMINYWRGKCVDHMSRDELLAAFNGLAEQYQSMQRINQIDRNMRETFAILKETK